MNGLRGEQAEPALQAMLERLYEDATSFGFPEERFDRVYQEVELTLYHDAVRARVIAPLLGAWMDAERVELGDGLSLVRGDALDGPHDPVDAPVRARARRAGRRPDPRRGGRRALRRAGDGGAALVPRRSRARRARLAPGRRTRRWQPVAIGSATEPRGAEWMLPAGDEQAFREFFTAIAGVRPPAAVAWALGRFEMGCARASDAEALSDYLLALRALLDATSDAGRASLGLRLAALCAEEGMRHEVQRPRWRRPWRWSGS